MRQRAGALLAAGLVSAAAAPALACVPPPPPAYNGGDLAEHRALSARLAKEFRQRQLWEYQVDLFDRASRVSLARVLTSESIPINADPLKGHRLELEPVEVYKGSPIDGQPRIVADKGLNSCDLYGGGSATRERPGSYVLLYEDVQKDGGTPHLAMLVSELRDPRILALYGKSQSFR